MARKIATLLALFIFFYLGAHFYIRWKNRIVLDTIKTTSLIECEPNQVRGLKILQREGAAEQMLVFERIDTAEPDVPAAAQLAKAQWKENSPAAGEASAVVMNRLASQVCELYDPIPQRPEAMVETAVPGRRAQRVEITLSKNGTTERHEIDFGQVGADRQNIIRYRSPNNGERVVKILPQLLQLSSREPKDYINRRVLRAAADNIQAATVSFDGKARFTLERQGAGWKVMSKGKERQPAKEVDRYLNTLSTLEALDVTPAESSECSAKPHKVAFDFTLIGGKKEYVGFDFENKGNVTACDSERPTKFTVHRDIVKLLDLPLKP